MRVNYELFRDKQTIKSHPQINESGLFWRARDDSNTRPTD
jgi:hypothetical protein